MYGSRFKGGTLQVQVRIVTALRTEMPLFKILLFYHTKLSFVVIRRYVTETSQL